MGFEGFPLIIGWELTLKCNIRCKHCGSSAGLPRKNELNYNEALNVCDQFSDLLVQEVDFTGGEPLMYPDWDKLSKYLVKNGITTRILTNAKVLNWDMMMKIKDAGVSSIGISLDGLEKTHDYIRGLDGLYRIALAGIENVLKSGLKVTVITTVNAANLEQLPEMLGMLEKIGVKNWQVQPLFQFGRSNNSRDLHLSSEQFLQFGRFFAENRIDAEKRGINMLPADGLGYFTELDTFQPEWQGCPAGIISCGITSDGNIKGCLSMPDHMVEGNLRERNLWSIWFDPESFKYTRGFDISCLGENCRSCEKGEQCKGGCTTMSYSSTGKIHNDPYCFLGLMRRNGGELAEVGAGYDGQSENPF